jgi:hypothetical protein
MLEPDPERATGVLGDLTCVGMGVDDDEEDEDEYDDDDEVELGAVELLTTT